MLLKEGSTGPDVKKLQGMLGIEMGGGFGPVTEEAVKSFQEKYGLLVDGVVGDVTWNKLLEVTTPEPNAALKLNNLIGHVPNSVIAQIPDTAAKFGITTPLRLAHFLAQCGHESDDFKLVVENLNYSEKRLLEIFKHDLDTNHDHVLSAAEKLKAKQLAKKPQLIANFVYANQNGNGNEVSGDGWKFRGRGYLQLTGRDNYASFAKFIGENVVATPDLVATKYPLSTAAYYFQSRNLWAICDKGSDDYVVEAVTRKVNGGTNGLAERLQLFKLFYGLLM